MAQYFIRTVNDFMAVYGKVVGEELFTLTIIRNQDLSIKSAMLKRELAKGSLHAADLALPQTQDFAKEFASAFDEYSRFSAVFDYFVRGRS